MSFNPGPLTRGPDGNIWFADPLAGIDIAGTIGIVDIATNVASEYSTPLMKTTIQISRRTSQDQKCDTGTACARRSRPAPACPIRPAPRCPASRRRVRSPAVPPIPAYLGSTCRTVTTGPTLVPACTPIAPTLANGYTTTTCPTTTIGPNSVIACTSRTRSRPTASSASSAPASRRDRRPTRSPPARTAISGSPSTTAPGSASSTSRPSSRPSTVRCRRRRRRSPRSGRQRLVRRAQQSMDRARSSARSRRPA